jgi:alkylresorcinol/alkylpyrone synthase
MPVLLSVERFLPPYRYDQEIVTRWVRSWLERDPGVDVLRLLSVYASSGVRTRASVVPIEEVFAPGDFETQNARYCQHASAAAVDVSRRAIEAAGLTAGGIDLVVSVSCTGFMIPSIDAQVADVLRLGPRLVRLPITESGCAGGVVGLARAVDFLTAHPERAALVVAVELSSLTFQDWDRSSTNVVSAAIFGDGGAAAVLVGKDHPLARQRGLARFLGGESVFFPGTSHLMGFKLRNQGLQIILDKGLAPFVRREVGPVVEGFLSSFGLTAAGIARFVLHPGGRRIIEVMAERLGLGPEHTAPTEAVLAEHGNMSSVTVLFVLDEILRRYRPETGALGLMGAFGPGFGAELALFEFL